MTKQQRLTEKDVFEACNELVVQGEQPTALILLERLGRGSLTTITKYMKSWFDTDAAKAVSVEELPATVKLPAELTREVEDLAKRMWHIANIQAGQELEEQKKILSEKERDYRNQLEEAEAFTEAQDQKIERLDEAFLAIKEQLDEEFKAHRSTQTDLLSAEADNQTLSQENYRLKAELELLKKQLDDQDKRILDMTKTHAKEVKQKEKVIIQLGDQMEVLKKKNTSLDVNIHKLQVSLDQAVQSNESVTQNNKAIAKQLREAELEVARLTGMHESDVRQIEELKNGLESFKK